MVSRTPAGPALHLPAPKSRSVAVGSVIVGPMPQINSPGLPGDRNTVGLMSPKPVPVVLGTAPPNVGNSDGWLMIGMIVRVIRFHSSLSLIGITGWTLRT